MLLYLVWSFLVVLLGGAGHVVRVDGFHVGVERGLLRVALLANLADEGSLSGVFPHVVVEVSLGSGGIIASLALERFLARVDPHVNLDRLLLRETLAANVAMVRTLTRMRSKQHF